MKEELLKIAQESLSSEEVEKIVKEKFAKALEDAVDSACLLYTSPSPRDPKTSRMPSSA